MEWQPSGPSIIAAVSLALGIVRWFWQRRRGVSGPPLRHRLGTILSANIVLQVREIQLEACRQERDLLRTTFAGGNDSGSGSAATTPTSGSGSTTTSSMEGAIDARTG